MAKPVSYPQWALEPYCIGMKLRALRNGKRLTLSRLAAETGLSTALLSKLETDRMIPTLPTLATISRIYGVGMSYFFTEPARHRLSLTRKAQLQSSGRVADAVRFTPLNVTRGGSPFAACIMEIPPGATAGATDLSRETTALVYLIEGRLQLNSGGMYEELEAGDCIFIESDMTLAWTNIGKLPCRMLAVTPATTSQPA